MLCFQQNNMKNNNNNKKKLLTRCKCKTENKSDYTVETLHNALNNSELCFAE